MIAIPLSPSLALGFVATAIVLTLIPGPDTMFVLANGMSQRVRGGMMAALGIGGGSLVHTTAAALGLSALIAASATAFSVVQWVGAAYLCWIGVQTLRAAWHDSGKLRGLGHAAVPLPVVFRRAALTSVMNGKVILFFLAMLPQFVDPSRGHVGLQLFLLGLTFNLIETVYLIVVGLAAGRAGAWLARSARFRRWLDAAAGAVFLGLGLRLALGGHGRG